MKTAFLVVDMQVGLFSDGSRHDQAGVVSRLNAVARAVRAGGGYVVFIHHQDEGGLVRGSAGWQILPTLERDAADVAVEKTACDSFYRSGLDDVLRALGVGRLIVGGCATDFCVDTTIRSAASKDYEIVVVADGHTTKDRPHAKAETVIAHHNWVWANLILPGRPVRVVPAAELLSELQGS